MEIVYEETGITAKKIEEQFEKVRHVKVETFKGTLLQKYGIKSKKVDQDENILILEKKDADTMVCDGATLKCSHAFYDLPESDIYSAGYDYVSPAFGVSYHNSIILKVPDYMVGIFLMGKDGTATTYCVHPENFVVDPELQCRKGGKCILNKMANEWKNVSPILLDGYNALTKDSILTCKNCIDAQITILDNGQDIELKGAEMEKMLIDFGITPEIRQLIGTGIALYEIVTGVKLIIKGGVLCFTGVGIPMGMATIGSGMILTLDGVRSINTIFTGEDIYVKQLSVIGVRKEEAEEYVAIYDNVMIITDLYGIVKGIRGISKKTSYSNIKAVADYNIMEESKYLFAESEKIDALNKNSQRLSRTNSKLETKLSEFESTFGKRNIDTLSPKEYNKYIKSMNEIKALEQSKADLLKNKDIINQSGYIPNYKSILDISDYKEIGGTSKDSVALLVDKLQNSKSISDLQVNYAQQRYGTTKKIVGE